MTSETISKPVQIGAGVAGVAVADMNPHRGTAVLVGMLFLIATATFFVSNALITPILGSHTFLAAVADHSQLMIAAGLIALIDGVAVLGIAAVLYPILKRPYPALAFGYGGVRTAELAAVAVFVLSTFLEAWSNSSCRSGSSREDSP